MEDFLLKLTPYQTIFYNEWMLSPSRIDYNIVFDQSMSGAIDIPRLNSSLVRFMNNHLLLNSNVINESGNLFWKHRPLLSADTQILTVFSEDPGPEEIFKLALQPFDLEKDPLARFYAIKLSNGGYRTIHIFHHIIIDGLSADSVYAELGVYYNDQDYVNPINLTEQKNLNEKLSDQFEKILAKGKTEMSDFWKNSLQEVENVGFKFLEHSGPFHSKTGKREPVLSNPVSEARFSFSEPVFLQVKELISKYKLTPYTYGQMVLAVLLHKISGINNLVINCPIGITEGQDFIFGANINTILKEYRFNKESSLQDLIDQNTEYTRQLKKSKGRYFPIEELVNYVPSNLLEFRFVQTNLKDVIIPYEGAGEVTINTELHVDLVGKLSFDQEVRDGVLNYKVRYSNQEFNAELVSGLAEMYERLFIDMLGDLLDENTHHLITDYELLDEKAYQHVMHYGNGIEAACPEDKTIHELFEAQVERTPDRTALVFNDVQLTYRELNIRANRLAGYLISTYDLQPDDLVPLCLERSEHMLIAILAVLKSGAAYVPMDPSYPSERIDHILQDTRAKLVLAQNSAIEKVGSDHLQAISVDEITFKAKLETFDSDNPVTKVNPNNLSYIIYTSGTTGLPKGVMIEHRNVVNVVSQVREAYGFSEGEKITAYTSYVFDVSVSEFFNSLFYGNELHLLDETIKKDADSISRYLLTHDIAYVYLPPVMLSVLPRIDYPSLKGLLYAGEACDYETGKYWSEARPLYNLYGPTEATIYATYKKLEHGDVHLIGRPVANTTAYILDSSHRLAPVGGVGELYLGGSGIARGYLNQETLTAERFIANPFQTETEKQKGKNGILYKTGDLARMLPDGNIEYLGRNDFQVKIRGYRIELGEIENRLQEYPGVRQSVVLAKENKSGLKYLVGYYVSEVAHHSDKLSEFLSESLPEYMIPGAFVHLESLPLTINGKLDRKQLPEADFTGEREYTAPETELQDKLCQAYGEVLGLESTSIGIYDDFFRLGGNSIMAIKLISKIKQFLDIQINVSIVFGHKTVVSLEKALTDENNKIEDIVITPVELSNPEDQKLSFAQERLWFIENYEGGSNAYNIPMVYLLGKHVQIEILQKSFEMLSQRHEVLRTVIRTTKNGEGYQMVTDQNTRLNTVALNAVEELDQHIDQAIHKVFHLADELPVSVDIFTLAGNRYLSVVVHHIAFDGWSTDIFIKELNAIYHFLAEGEPHKLPESKIQYKDFALWQRSFLVGERLDKQIFYWKNKLEGFQTLDLPLDFKRPAHMSYDGETTYFDIPAELATGLRAISKDFGVSLYSVMLSSYYLMLSAYSGQDDIIVGSPVANRHHAGLEDIIGFFVNTLALREHIDPEQNLKDFILQVSASVMESQSHQDLPFEKLVEELEVEKDTSRNPIFQVMFGIQNFDGGLSSNKEDAVLHAFDKDINYKSAKFDLTMLIDDNGERVRGILNYAVSLFKRETVMRMKDTYMYLLEQIVRSGSKAAENIRISNLSLTTEGDHKNIIENWNGIEANSPEDKTIHELFEAQVERTPDRTALVFNDVQLTYRELNTRANRLAGYLISTYDLQPDDLVPLCLERSEHMLIAILAVLKSGAAYVPMDPSYPSERIDHILQDTGAKLVLAQNSTIEKVESDHLQAISVDEITFKAKLETFDSDNPVTKVNPNNLSYIIYTSGTTGLPKGVMIEHRNVVNVVSQVREAYGFSEGEKITAYTSYVFDVSVSEFFNSLFYGNELHLLDETIKKDADSISRYLLTHDIAYVYLPPVMLSVLPRIDYPSLKGLLYAGEACDYETGKYWSEARPLYNLYGPTESTIYATYKKLEHGDVHLIGRPVANTTAYILDSSHRLVPVGGVGELYLGGSGIARGYLNQETLTAERFIVNPFQTEPEKQKGKNGILYKTGDLARMLPDGNIEYLGRNDFQVKIRGYRIELGEIENMLQEYPGVRQSVVLAKENKAGLKYLVGYYVSEVAHHSDKLSEFLSESLPEYMIPGAFVHLESLPLTINGKLDRKQLPEADFTGEREYTAPETELQEKLCQAYGEVLGLESTSIGIYDDFFRLGGNSIMAIKLISKIRQHLDLSIQVAAVFSHKTIASLASVLEGESKDSYALIAPIEVSSPEEQRLSFAQERLWFIEAYEGGSDVYNIPMSFRLDQKIQLELLQKSMEIVIMRHEVLRSVIRTTESGMGYQFVTDLIPEFNVTEVETEEELKEQINEYACKVFHLGTELPIEVNILRLEEQSYLSVVIHHIAFDGWSVNIFLREIQTVYEALVNGKDYKLPEIKFQYKDFALWQRNYLTGEILEKQIHYWKNELEDFESLNMPLDFNRPTYISYEGATAHFNLSGEVASGLRKLSKDFGVSLYSVMLGGYYLMLSAYSGQDDIVVGSPIANRHHAELEDLIGFFVNTLALRKKIDSEQTIKDFILEISSSVIEAQSHQDLPFEKLVDELGVEQDTSRHPVFQVMFGLQSFERDSSHDESAIFYPFNEEIEYHTAKFDLTTMIDDSEETIRGMFNYATSLFKRETIMRIKDTYLMLLKQLSDMSNEGAEHIKINELQLLEETNYRQVTEEWNATDSTYPFDKTIHQLFEEQVVKTPDHIALVYQDVRLSYAELNAKANRLANHLVQTYGLQPDDLVPLCLKRSENMLIAILGVMKAGAAYVPMDPSYPEDRIEHILRDTEAKIILAQNSTIGKIEVSENTKVISLDEVTFKAMLETADPNNPVTGVGPDNLAYVIYTSGTTGLPKGVMIEHKGVSNLIEQQTREFDLDSKPNLPFSPKNCLWYANYVFDAHVCELYPVITHGHSIYLLDKERQTDIAALQQYITDNQISLASIPPALLTKDFILSVEKLIVAGDVTNPQVMAFYQAAGVDIINGYGPTEGTVCTSVHHYNEDGNPLNIGGPIGNMKAYVVDRYHRIVPIGAVGELYIGGAGIARGYLNRAELTSERFILNPFQSESEQSTGENGRLYKTGDLVRWLPNGELEYIGRNDFQVKIRGFRIELGEIENQLLQYPEIRQTAVLAKDSKTGMKYLVGYYVSDTAIDSETLSAHLSSSLPDYMVPSAYVHLENLPLTINGKLDKKRLPEPEFTGSKDYTAPETPLQVQLCQIYGEVLGLDPGIISIHDDFFRLGGDSIISIQLVSRIRQQLEVRLSVKEIFTARTVSGLSHLITDKKSGSGDTIQSEQGLLSGEVPLLPIQEWYFSQKTEGYLPAFNHWNQSFLIHVPELDPSLLEKSVHHLLEKHDAFRIHYPQENGTYSQQYGGGSLPVIKTLDITGMTAEELTGHLTKWQSDFDIETGPLFQIGYLSGYEDKSARIYFALHHLIIDGVSWRIITDDLKTLYQTLEKGTPIAPPVKGSSYRQWVNAIKTYQSETPALKDQELSYWNNIIETVKESTHSLSRLITDGHHQGYVLLDKTYTGKLIRGSHHAYHTQINDLLLAALSCALTGLTGEKSNAILLESHGREDVFSHLDITETVGWFTSMYPLLLKTGTDVKDTIIHTKESLRSIPNNGIGYGSLIGYTKAGLPKISFNYLGQLDQEDTSGDKTWFIAAEGSGISNSPDNRDSHMISINGATIDGQLRFGISGYLSSEHISKFSSDFKTHLETLIDHLSQETRSYLTPSDVGHIVDHTQLAKIQEHRETEGVYLANSLQEGFIYHALNQGEKDDAYRVQLIWDYYAEIEPSKLKTSWKLAQQNYPSLRLRFDWNGEIVQVIDKTGEVDWRYHDISAMSESAQHSHIQELTRKDRFEIYDLSQGRLFRVYLFKRSENHYSCLFSNHHAILDGWSLPVLLNSIHDAYQALLKNHEPIFTPDLAYGDTQKYLQGHKEQGNTFWHNYMSLLEDQEDLSSLVKESQRHIDLGTYRHIQDHQQVKMQIEGDQYQILKTLTKEKGLTVNAVLQYLWHKQLSIYSGLGTTVVGTTVSGRSLPVDGIESSVGLYINTLPLIVNHGEGRVLDHILEIQERISELNTYSDVNLGSLHHDGRRIFSSLFVYENYPVPKGEGENKLSFEFKAAVEKLDYPLGVMAAEQEGIVALEIKYEGILFERHTIEGLIEGMEILLGQILEDWQIDSKELSFVSDSQMSLMQKWNDATETAYPVNKTIHELFETQVLKTPDAIAVVYQDTKLSYKTLNESANRLAHYLVENHGLQPDDLVPLCLERSENMLIAILAVMKSGAAYVPMDPSYPAERIEYILQDTGAKIILAESSTSEKIQPAENTEVICLDDMAFKAMLEASDLDNPVTTVKAENLAYVIYTSGTTGLPKGVMIEHKGVVNLIGSMIQTHRLEDYQQVGCYSNYVFDAFVYESLPVLCNGNTLWLYSNDLRTSVSDLNLYIKENGIEVSFIPPVLLKEIVDNKTSLKLIFAGGESFPALDQNIENITLINEYGPTEGTVCATLHHYKEDHNPLNIGSPINNTTSYVLDDHLRILPVGAVGELYIGGAGIARGYLKQPELTEERFIQNPFQTTEQKEKGVNGRLYKTGDLVRCLSDGELEYMGRNDFQVKIRGYRIELGEIENRLLQYPGVKQAVVLAKESKTGMNI